MKITNERTFVNFSELNAGDVFMIYDFGPCMKTKTKGTCNAINLDNGEFIECGDYCRVQKVDCELIIR